MNGDWILCERTQRWAAAIRHALGRERSQCDPRRLYETRSLADMLLQLSARPDSLVFIEVHRGNFTAVLECLADAAPRFPSARFAALLDGHLAPTSDRRSTLAPSNQSEAIDALAEAGAGAFASSPRRLSGTFALARQHANRLGRCATPSADQPLAAWAMSLLTWQDA